MNRKKPRVVVTGLGAITAIGENTNELWDSVVSGIHGIHRVDSLNMDGYMTNIAGEVKFRLEDLDFLKERKTVDRAIEFALRAGLEALQSANLLGQLPKDTGCVMGTCLGGANSWEKWLNLRTKGDHAEPALWKQLRFNGIAETVSSEFGIFGPVVTISTACAAGGNAIGHAADLIRSGKASVVLAGGADALSILAVAGFHSLQSLSSEACKPYSGDRDGLSLGEGAGILVLENEEHARARQANIFAEVLEFGLSADGYHPTAPHPEGEGASRAIRKAIEKSGIQPEDIDYINGHGTGTPKNDSAETMAIKRALGENAAQQVKVSSTKSMIGHLLGAAGAVEGIVTVLSLFHNIIPPTANFTTPDPECDLDYTPNMALHQQQLDYAISNNFAFGGNNCSVVFRKYDPYSVALSTNLEKQSEERIVITGMAQIGAVGTDIDAFWNAVSASEDSPFSMFRDAEGMNTEVSAIQHYDSTSYIARKEARRMDKLSKLAVSVAMEALKNGQLEITSKNASHVGVILGTANGTMESLENFYIPVMNEGAVAANPAYFPNTVFNQAAGQVAMHTQALGVSSTVVDGHASFSSSVCMAYEHLRNGDADAILSIAADVLTPLLISGYKDSGWLENSGASKSLEHQLSKLTIGEGATAIIVETLTSALTRKVPIYAEIKGYGRTYDANQDGGINQSSRGIERAMEIALLESDVSANQIDAVFVAQSEIAHADFGERASVANLFYDANPYVSSCKHVMGEAQGAAAGFQMITAILSMENGRIPQLTEEATTQIIDANIERVLVNAVSLTGSNTSLLLCKYE
ncbi:beta-ketoacyl-[acyl-carrier-protein] synthase family protein [Paenibacillus endoradicis]|uniref:beta-ketoacyl-[acyl-carrier-protein] synthase family protein n=1 Tax=Paenibacillus endoradicis TaxID=2972487 RepID=UPI00215955C1|nr:beta-ketoacyl-[acyl-carrier-protein] synthase family protein [Paenibacillus endoradicis]MCR8657737.1 beta-ketoacyl-[acyl-carrier-protein] synthase family protein [Paenibacillus endoradicis]